MTFTIFDAVANINNNINSNNNNNNNDNINFQQSINTVVSGNINVANQINVMNVMGRRRREANGTFEGIKPEMKKRAGAVARQGFDAMISLHKNLQSGLGRKQLERRLSVYGSI